MQESPTSNDRWSEIQERAFRMLEGADRLEPKAPLAPFAGVVRLWQHAAPGPCRSWTIFENVENSLDLVIREVTWRSERDEPRVRNPVERLRTMTDPLPTIELRDIRLAGPELRRELDRFLAFAAPPLDVDKPFGSGGETFGLKELRGTRELWLAWWEAGPPEWHFVTEWARGIRALCMTAS